MTRSEDARLMEGIKKLLREYTRSVVIHTDWQEYEPHAVFGAVEDEFREFRQAIKNEQYTGAHGVAGEALHLACVALKAHLYYANQQPIARQTLKDPAPYFTYQDN